MNKKINLQQYRNYNKGWKYVIRILIYIAILILVLLFVRFKLNKIEPSKPESEDGIEVFLDLSKE